MLSNVIVDVTIPRFSFVFGQSRAKVSVGFTNGIKLLSLLLSGCTLLSWDAPWRELTLQLFIFLLSLFFLFLFFKKKTFKNS